ncbi:glutamine amidotransferase [Desulfovibrio sp. 86]|uniref:CTP synthase (glutamine hydrolyzing) n=1 Tax=uncultured Desulfovibrio sp. TaxID=167968 RepID=A0A212L539_9BACT|nr:glutamine amidotransferase [Desulfovibrio sp. 86]SCM72636.1 conserved hypothetical protein [uncultured Desulfovibrio sp.]VZH33647.1 conserved protein of unknown function [Desulfovibrio sp. 86]
MKKKSLRIGIIGDFDAAKKSHIATVEALRHCGSTLHLHTEIMWISTQTLEDDAEKHLSNCDGVFCAPGSPYASLAGALRGIRFAREANKPFLGTCGGFQHALLEFAVNALGMAEAAHEEYSPDAVFPVVSRLSCTLREQENTIFLLPSCVRRIYGKEATVERYNCGFGLNPAYQARFTECGFNVVGMDAQGEARIMEMPSRAFFVGTLFQPQLSSTPENPHPLLLAFIKTAAGEDGERA